MGLNQLLSSVSRPRASAGGIVALALSFAAGLAGVTATPAVQAQPPRYNVERCCQLCPAAADPAAYNTSFLEVNKLLLDGRQGWMFRTESDLNQHFGPDAEGLAELRRFAQALRARGTELVLIYLPTRGLVHPDELSDANRGSFNYEMAKASYVNALNNFRSLGITVPDFTPLLREQPRTDAYYFKRDHHWTPYGAERAAKIVAETVSRMPAYAELTQKKFATVRNGMMRKTGTLQMAAARLCGTGYSDQWVPTYGTAVDADGEAGGGDALFGDDSAPQVTLIGTSFSKGAVSYNFDGYLQQFLGVEILNEAMAGSGYDGAMIQYLPSEAFQKNPPRILLWEVPSYYSLAASNFYREAVPLVSDGCNAQTVQLSARHALKPGGITEVLFNGGGKVLPIKGRTHQLDIRFSDPSIREAKAQIWYMNGRKDSLKLEHGKRVNAQGRFVYELRTDKDYSDLTMLSMDLELPPDAPQNVTVEAKVCARPSGVKQHVASK